MGKDNNLPIGTGKRLLDGSEMVYSAEIKHWRGFWSARWKVFYCAVNVLTLPQQEISAVKLALIPAFGG
jgi:hypothetical protein